MRAAATPFDPATVSLEPGISLVEASAGTGKTYSITQLVLRLLLDRSAAGAYRVEGIGNILVVTFTNAATDELITRVRTMLREATDVFAGVITAREGRESLFALRDQYGVRELPRLREALASLDQLSIFTIHGWSKRVLEEHALESGTPFGAQFLEEDELLVERITQDWWRRTMYEDEQLATLAVHQEWKHDAFRHDLKKWQRLPSTPMDPKEELAAARTRLTSALNDFASVWNPAGARSFLDSLKWRKNAPLAAAAVRGRIVESGNALAAGDLAAGLLCAASCTTAAIRNEKTGITMKPAEAFASVAQQPFVKACDQIMATLESMVLALRVSCLLEVHRRLDEEKRRRHMLGFDDLLRRLNSALVKGGANGHLAQAIRTRYGAALIDEFQDTDPFQFPIFSTAFAGRPLFLIGDPKQAIYGFRGADLFSYMDAVDSAERHYTLGRNWRSTDRMIGAVNALFDHRPSAFLYPRIGFAPAVAARPRNDPLAGDGRGSLHWWVMPPEDGKSQPCQLSKKEASRRVLATLAREVVRLLSTVGRDGAPMRPGQLAVLVRTTREGLAAQGALRAVGVPCIVSGLDDILKSRELTELEWLLRAVLMPGDARGVRAALTTELWGMDASAIRRLSLAEYEHEWQDVIERLAAWREEWVRHGFMRMVQGMLAYLKAAERLLGRDDGERRLTNLRHAVELLHGAATEERLSPEGVMLWITRTRATGEVKAERTELRLETDADAVQITTIHKSKGLEYDVVFCPGLWATRRARPDEPILVHMGESASSAIFDHGSSERATRGRLAAAEELAEELRLVYVALTRARLRCYVAWGAVTNKSSGIHAGHTGLGYLLRASRSSGEPADLAQSVPAEFVLGLADWDATFRALVAASDGAMTTETLTDLQAPVAPWAGNTALPVEPHCRTDLPPAESLRSWRVASFTSLTAGSHVEDPRDVGDASDALASETVVAPTPKPDDFLAFPAGRRPGVALHELFELVGFAATPADVRALATEVMQRHQFGEAAERITAVTTMVTRVLGATMPGAGFALRDIPRDRTLREWTFHLPMGDVQRNTFTELFATHGDALGRRYAQVLRRLSVERVNGFLTGVVDLAFERGGRWYIVDWKSNHLGTDPAHYEGDHLECEIFASHYVLQYHLYIVALHRFLRLRQPGYTYETHIGGAWYAFLRGIDGSERGWFHDRPPRALIDALDALMGGATVSLSGADA